MAFVYRSERKMHAPPNDNNKVGPGQYIKINHFNSTQAKVPFNSSNNRDRVKLDSTPGPGSYNLLQSKSLNDISKSANTNTSATDLNSSNPFIKSNEKLGFLTKVNRFQHDKETNKSPGPGYYDSLTKETSSTKEEKKFYPNLIQQKKNIINTGSIKRIVSIPSKEMHGYVIENNGNALMLLDSILNDDPPNKNKNNELGPGSYEVLSTWKGNAIEWKKTNHEKSKAKKAKYDEKTLIEELKRQGDFVPKLPIDDSRRLVYSRLRSNSLSGIPLPVVKPMRERDMSYIAVSESPGPGYYTKEFVLNTNSDVLYKDERSKQHGSREERFKENEYKDDVGPTSYFQSKNKYEPNNKQFFKGLQTKSLHKPNENKIELIKQINRYEVKAGPGSYDLAQGFLKRAVSSKEIFNTGIERFAEVNAKEIRPGPGAYVIQPFKQEEIAEINRKRECLTGERYQVPKSSSPPVGSYNPDVLNSIRYQIESKVNPAQSNIAPFNKTGKRFEFDKMSNIGPGAYSKEVINVVNKNNNRLSCFNSKDKRFPVQQTNPVGPSDYDNSRSVEWDKKSFNVLFFKQPKPL